MRHQIKDKKTIASIAIQYSLMAFLSIAIMVVRLRLTAGYDPAEYITVARHLIEQGNLELFFLSFMVPIIFFIAGISLITNYIFWQSRVIFYSIFAVLFGLCFVSIFISISYVFLIILMFYGITAYQEGSYRPDDLASSS